MKMPLPRPLPDEAPAKGDSALIFRCFYSLRRCGRGIPGGLAYAPDPVASLVSFGKGLRADMGQTRGAQSGEADRHSVWLTANNLEPKLSPFDPFAILDEIQRVVPGYDKLLRLQLLSGNDQHIAPATTGLVQIEGRKDLVLPSGDTLFTSGSLTKFSPMLQDVQRHQATEVADHLASAD